MSCKEEKQVSKSNGVGDLRQLHDCEWEGIGLIGVLDVELFHLFIGHLGLFFSICHGYHSTSSPFTFLDAPTGKSKAC